MVSILKLTFFAPLLTPRRSFLSQKNAPFRSRQGHVAKRQHVSGFQHPPKANLLPRGFIAHVANTWKKIFIFDVPLPAIPLRSLGGRRGKCAPKPQTERRKYSGQVKRDIHK